MLIFIDHTHKGHDYMEVRDDVENRTIAFATAQRDGTWAVRNLIDLAGREADNLTYGEARNFLFSRYIEDEKGMSRDLLNQMASEWPRDDEPDDTCDEVSQTEAREPRRQLDNKIITVRFIVPGDDLAAQNWRWLRAEIQEQLYDECGMGGTFEITHIDGKPMAEIIAEEQPQTRTAPGWAWRTIDETLVADSHSKAFDAELRDEIKRAYAAMVSTTEQTQDD